MITRKSVAIVTGASQGIGRATALRLAREVAVIVVVARDKDKLEQTGDAITLVGAEAMIYALDLREPESAGTVVNGTVERFGRIDAVLNTAGVVPQIDLFEMTDGQWNDGMALKFHGARRLTMRAWDALKASNAALNPKPAFAAVAVINAAINALAKAFAEQGIKDGIQVNSISPGIGMTERRRAFFEKWAARSQHEDRRGHQEVSSRSRGLSRRNARRDCRSHGLSRFASAKWMTGASVRMDGGEIKSI